MTKMWWKRLKKVDTDFETNLIYFLFSEKNVMPKQYYDMPEGEKAVIRAMFLKQMEDRKNKLLNAI